MMPAAAADAKTVLSIIVEQDTRRLLERLSFDDMLVALAEHVATLPDGQVEVLLVGANVPRGAVLPPWATVVPLHEPGYYASKTAGAQAARGDYLVFWDSDCQAVGNYVSIALEALRADPSLLGVTGVTRYRGTSWISRLNTVLSFGYLYQPLDKPTPYAALAHNVVLRRSAIPNPRSPFGPYRARSGGDAYLTRSALLTGSSLRLVHRLVIFHEDPSFSLAALLDRHLREHFNPLVDVPNVSQARVAATVIPRVLRSYRRRTRKVRKYEPFMEEPIGLKPIVAGVLFLYLALDLVVAAVVVALRPVLDRWLTYQFGMDLASWDSRSLS